MLIPAVSAVRAYSRKLQCANNLKQLGVALAEYDASHFPVGNSNRGFSHLVLLLPHIEQANLYNSLNFVYDAGGPPPLRLPANSSFLNISLSLFLCPDDAAPSVGTSYAGNIGTGFCEKDSYKHCQNGVITLSFKPIAYSEVSDGMSNTVAMSEWLRLDKLSERNTLTVLVPYSNDFAAFAAWCVRPSNRFDLGDGKGMTWIDGGGRSTLYTHDLSPNNTSCLNGGHVQQSAWTAASRHSGNAVNSLFCDGHCAAIKRSIDSQVWRALGTRAGGESSVSF